MSVWRNILNAWVQLTIEYRGAILQTVNHSYADTLSSIRQERVIDRLKNLGLHDGTLYDQGLQLYQEGTWNERQKQPVLRPSISRCCSYKARCAAIITRSIFYRYRNPIVHHDFAAITWMGQSLLTARRAGGPICTCRWVCLHIPSKAAQRNIGFPKSHWSMRRHTTTFMAPHAVRFICVRVLGRRDGGFDDAI